MASQVRKARDATAKVEAKYQAAVKEAEEGRTFKALVHKISLQCGAKGKEELDEMAQYWLEGKAKEAERKGKEEERQSQVIDLT